MAVNHDRIQDVWMDFRSLFPVPVAVKCRRLPGNRVSSFNRLDSYLHRQLIGVAMGYFI